MDTNTVAIFEVTTVSPIQFNVTVKAATLPQIYEWKYSIKQRHGCIDRIDYVNGFDLGGRLCYVRTLRFTLHSDADYQQLCALRAELKA